MTDGAAHPGAVAHDDRGAAATDDVWRASYPDLAGRCVVVGGAEPGLVRAVGVSLLHTGVLLTVVCPDRGVVEALTTLADAAGRAAMGVVADPTEPAVWVRVLAAAEQRLAPVDVVVSLGAPEVRRVLLDAALPDMRARRRGVAVECGPGEALAVPTDGVRSRTIEGGSATDVAATVALFASDVLAAGSLRITLSG